jgi:hypothetical protein
VTTGLWRINLKQANNCIPNPIANNVYELRNTGALVHYLHKALFSPTKAAMLQAVKDGYLITWPGLTEDAINKHLKLMPASAMGHMNQRRHNIWSTSKAPIEKQQSPDKDLGTKTHLVYAVVVDQGQLYTGLTAKVPGAIQQRTLLCDGLLHLLLQLYQSRSHEIKVRLVIGQII